MLGGSDNQSVAWNLTTQKLIFNACEIKDLPAVPLADGLPHTVVMALNMDEGSLAFKTDDEHFDMAMQGLHHVSSSFHIAACLHKSGDEITVKYLGSLGNVLLASITFH